MVAKLGKSTVGIWSLLGNYVLIRMFRSQQKRRQTGLERSAPCSRCGDMSDKNQKARG